jgi:hypothetical protein
VGRPSPLRASGQASGRDPWTVRVARARLVTVPTACRGPRTTRRPPTARRTLTVALRRRRKARRWCPGMRTGLRADAFWKGLPRRIGRPGPPVSSRAPVRRKMPSVPARRAARDLRATRRTLRSRTRPLTTSTATSASGCPSTRSASAAAEPRSFRRSSMSDSRSSNELGAASSGRDASDTTLPVTGRRRSRGTARVKHRQEVPSPPDGPGGDASSANGDQTQRLGSELLERDAVPGQARHTELELPRPDTQTRVREGHPAGASGRARDRVEGR